MQIIVSLILFLALFFGGILAIGDVWARYQCSNFKEITGKDTRYATLDICYIKTAEGWQRWDEYKARAAASEGLKAGTR